MTRNSETTERWKWPPSATGLLQLDYDVPELGEEPPVLPSAAERKLTPQPRDVQLMLPPPAVQSGDEGDREESVVRQVIHWWPVAVAGTVLAVSTVGAWFFGSAIEKEAIQEQVESAKRQAAFVAEKMAKAEADAQRWRDNLAERRAAQIAWRVHATVETFTEFGQIPRIGLTNVRKGMVFRLVPSMRVTEVVDRSSFLAHSSFDNSYGWEQYLIENVNTEDLADGREIRDDDIRCEGCSLPDLTFYCSGNVSFRGRTVIRIERFDNEIVESATEKFISKRPGANPLDLDHSDSRAASDR